jgi:hypothetical protein
MEPFSLIFFAIGAAVGGVIGNRADSVFCQALRAVTEQMKQGGPPVNLELQRAVRKAYLQATLVVYEACMKSTGVLPSAWQRDLRVMVRPSEEVRWLDAVRRAIHEELRQLPHADYVPPSTEAVKQVELLLQPKGTIAAQRTRDLCKMLKQSVLDELRQRYGEPPARFAEMVWQGWDDSAPGGMAHLDWFDLLCAFFVHDMKTNEKVRGIFEGQLLAQLTVEGIPITFKCIQAQFEEFGKNTVMQLERIDVYLAQLRSEQVENFAALQDRIDEVLPLLVCLPGIDAKQHTAIEMLQAILDILTLPPLPRPDYTVYLQDLRERVRELTARECTLFRLANFDPLTDAMPLQLANWNFDCPVGLPLRDSERGTAEDILAKHPRLVIVADGGAGKTTLARRWAYALAEQALTDENAHVPVYVEMNQYQQGKLHELIAASAELDSDTLQSELRARQFALIFDGLNEVAADVRTDAVRELRTLLTHDEGNRVIVTTRKHGYNDDLRLPTFVIEPLCEDDIRAFVVARVDGEKDVERAEKLAKKLLADHRLRSLAENPMMLTMLAAIFGPLGDFPRNRGQLFKAFVDGVFAWEEQILKTSVMHLDRAIKESCLAAIAYRLTEHGKVSTEKLTVGNWIADKLDEMRLKKLDWMDVYDELLRNGLLVESRGKVRFLHEVWVDYFCAVDLSGRLDNILTHIESSRFDWHTGAYLSETKWHESIFLLAGIVDAPDVLVREILQRDVLLAARCCLGSNCYADKQVCNEVLKRLIKEFGQQYWAFERRDATLLEYWEQAMELANPSVDSETFNLIALYAVDLNDNFLRHYAVECCKKIDTTKAIEFFESELFASPLETEESSRVGAATALGLIETEYTLMTLRSALSSIWRSQIRDAAFKAIWRLEWLDEREAAQNAINAARAAIDRRLELADEDELVESNEEDSYG